MAVLPFQKATPYDTGVAPFDPNATVKAGQQTQLGALGLQLEAIKAQRAQEAWALQQSMLGTMSPAEKLAFAYSPEQAGGALAKALYPELKNTAVGRQGALIGPHGEVLYQSPDTTGVTWEGDPSTSPSANLRAANPLASPGAMRQPTILDRPADPRTAPQPTPQAIPQAAKPPAPVPGPPANGPPIDLTGARRAQETGGMSPAAAATARNPNSTAYGPDQFIESTWLEQLQRHAPEVITATVGPNANLRDKAVRKKLLDLRSDAALSARLSGTLQQENAVVLQAQGLEASPRNLITAHFLGATGAARFLRAPPDDLGIRHASREAIEKNRSRFFDPKTGQPYTVGQMLGMADQLVARNSGGAAQPPAASPAPAPAPGATPAAAAAAPTVQPANANLGANEGWQTATKGGLPAGTGAKPGTYWQRRPIGKNPTTGKTEYEYRTVDASGSTAGPFGGTGDGQYLNTLLTKGRDTPEYAAAYWQLTQPKYIQITDPDDPSKQITMSVTPKLPPSILPPLQPGTAGTAAATPNSSAGGQPGGTNTGTATAPPQPAEVPNVASPPAEAQPIPGTQRGGGPTAAQRKALNEAEIEIAKIKEAMKVYRGTIEKTGGPGLSSLLGLPTSDASALNTDYNNLALLAKGETLYHLGVLNGPDLDIIRRTLTDPSTWRGAAADKKVLLEQIDKVENIIDTALKAARQQYGGNGKPGDPGDFTGMGKDQLLKVDPSQFTPDQKRAYLAALRAAK